MENVMYSSVNTGLSAAMTITGLVIAVFGIVTMWLIFTKAGEPGWKCLIPFYNIWVYYRLIFPGSTLIMFILTLIPIANIVVNIYSYIRLAKCFGYGAGMAVLLILCSPIGQAIIAFGSSEYLGRDA